MPLFTRKELLPIVIILFVIIFSIFVYSSLPEQVPSHWNAQGEIDDWSSRSFTVWFYPSLVVGIYLLMVFVPLIDPLKRNYNSFRIPYYWLRTGFVIFFSALYLFTVWTALGGDLNVNYFILPLLSLLFILIGLFLPKVKKNYFVGIRTPWTLASEETWNKTHALGGKLFILVGLVSMLGFFLCDKAILLFMISIFAAIFALFVYSYFIFKRVEGFKENNN